MNRWDSLAGWLYQRQATPWQRVKQACQSLSHSAEFGADWSPLGHATFWIRPLLELGVVEFDSKSILACQPGIIWTHGRRRGLLFGYWTATRINRLRKFARVFRKNTDRGPTCFSAVGSRQELLRAAEDCAAWFSDDPGEQLLSSLPSVTDWIQSMPEDTSSPTGVWEMLSFRNRRPVWVSPREVFVQPGLYRRKSGSPIDVHVVGDSHRLVTNPDQRAVAMWFEYPAHSWVFLSDRSRLLVPFGSPRLPLLVARALVVGAGYVAKRMRYDNELWWSYSYVTLKKAKLASAILQQDLIIK